MLGFMAKKASMAVRMFQWKSSSGMTVAGSRTAPRRFPCVPANPAPVLTQAETAESKGQSSAPSCAPGAPPAAVTEVLQPRGAPEAGQAWGNAGKCPARELPTNMQNTNSKSRPDLPVDIPPRGYSSLWIFWKAESEASPQLPKQRQQLGGSQAEHRSHPSTTAQSSSPHFMLQNTWLMRKESEP